MIIIFRDVGKMRTCVPRNVHDISGIATIKHTYCNFTVFCIPEIASRNKNDILYFARIKYECCSSITCCVPELAPHNIDILLYVVTIKRINIL